MAFAISYKFSYQLSTTNYQLINKVSGVSREQIRVLDSLYFIAASIPNCNSSHRRLLYHIRNPPGRLCNELHKNFKNPHK